MSGDGDGEGGSGPRGGARGVGRPWVCCGLPVSDPAVSAGTLRARSTRSSTGARKQVKG